MILMVFNAAIAQGRIVLDNHEAFEKAVNDLEGRRVTITINDAGAFRSAGQNAYYHGIVLPLFAVHCGYEKKDLHRELKERFGVTSTSKLTVTEFREYIDGVAQLAAEMGCVIPVEREQSNLFPIR